MPFRCRNKGRYLIAILGFVTGGICILRSVRKFPLIIHIDGFLTTNRIVCIVYSQYISRVAEILVVGIVGEIHLCDVGSNSLFVLHVASHVVGQEEIVVSFGERDTACGDSKFVGGNGYFAYFPRGSKDIGSTCKIQRCAIDTLVGIACIEEE